MSTADNACRNGMIGPHSCPRDCVEDDMTTRITSSDCGCYTVDGEQTLWCAHHVTGLTETIKARERSITDLRYDVIGAQSSAKVAEDKAGMYQSLMEQAIRERDEWKAKAERKESLGSLFGAERIRELEDENRGLRSDIHGKSQEMEKLRRENDALQDAVKHLREQIPDMSSNATHYCCYHMRRETREGAEV